MFVEGFSFFLDGYDDLYACGVQVSLMQLLQKTQALNSMLATIQMLAIVDRCFMSAAACIAEPKAAHMRYSQDRPLGSGLPRMTGTYFCSVFKGSLDLKAQRCCLKTLSHCRAQSCWGLFPAPLIVAGVWS